MSIGGIRCAIPPCEPASETRQAMLAGGTMSIQLVYDPIAGLKDDHRSLEEGEIIHLENQKTKFD
jgi:hypothetical protein